MDYEEKVVILAKKRRKKGKSKKIRTKSSWSEFRARLTSGSKAKLLSIIKILWSSASITAKNKCIKLAAMKSFSGKIKRATKRKGKGKRKGKKKAWQIKGSVAAKRHMAKIRKQR